MADWEIPLAAASFLKSLSHASELPVPQDAASAGAPGIIRTALTAKALKRNLGVIGTICSEIVSPWRVMTKQGKMSAATAAKTRLSARAAPNHTKSACVPKPPVDNPAVRWQLLISPVLRVVLAPPWKQCGREIRRRTPFPMRARQDWSRIGIRCDHLAIEMPGGVAEQRYDDGEAEEERQRSRHQQ